MARGITTLEQIVANIRMESHRSPDRNFGKDQYAAIAHLAKRVQYFLYWDHNWAFLKGSRTLTLNAGQQFYDAPLDMDFERIFRARTNTINIWHDLERGIDVTEDYNSFDPDDDERQDPAYKWDILNTEATVGGSPVLDEQIEIWPLPATTGGIVKFRGILGLGPFVSDNDVCTLDNTLIELFAAAELLAGDERADASAKLSMANRLYARMRAGSARRTPVNSISMAGAEHFVEPWRRRVRVISPQNSS